MLMRSDCHIIYGLASLEGGGAEFADFNPSGCVAAVGGKEGLLYLSTPGNFTYGELAPVSQSNPPMTNTVSQ